MYENSDPSAVIPFLKKCFENVSSIEFKKSAAQEIIALFSSEKERINLVNVRARRKVRV